MRDEARCLDVQPATEQTGCELCGAAEFRPILRKRGHRLVACGGCSLMRVEPLPSPAEIARLYDSGAAEVPQRYARFELERARRLARVVGPAPRGGRLLDVGCATGSFLVEARPLGWDTHGLEVAASKAAHARERHGLHVEQGRAEEVATRFGEGAFDVVTLWDVLEHLRQPLAAMREVGRVLAPGGRIYLATPDLDGWVARFHFACIRPLWGIWPHPEPPRHLYQFSRTTIRRLCREAGFGRLRFVHDEIPLWYTSGFRGEPQLAQWLHGEDGVQRARSIYAITAPVFLAARLARRGDSMIVCAARA